MVYSNSLKTANEARHAKALTAGSRHAKATAKKRGTNTPIVKTLPPECGGPPVNNQVTQPPAVKPRLRRYALVYDMSGSMSSCSVGAVKMAAALKDRLIHEDSDGHTVVSLVLFGSNVELSQKNYKPKGLKDIYTWPSMGMTALYDAVIQATEAIEEGAGPDDTFCVITVTDGCENQSVRYRNPDHFAGELGRRQATDRYTFVFNLPPGRRAGFIAQTGLPAGNMQEWSDIGQVEQTVATGITNYTRATQAGSNSVQNFLVNTPLEAKDLVGCPDVKDKVKVWHVDKTVKLSDCVREHGIDFEIGRAYYQFTKSERVEAGKDMLAIEKTFNANGSKTVEKIYSGVRPVLHRVLNLPDGEIRKLVPGNLGNYEIYIKSTSDNRNLLPGTRVIYFVK